MLLTPVLFVPICQLEHFVQDIKESDPAMCIVKLTHAVALNYFEHLKALVHEKDPRLDHSKFLLLAISIHHLSIPIALEILGLGQELTLTVEQRSFSLANILKIQDRAQMATLFSSIIKTGPISQTILELCYFSFITHRDYECLKTLIDGYYFPRGVHETQAFKAAKLGHIDCLELIVKKANLSQSILNSLMIDILENCYAESLFLFFNHVPLDIRNPHGQALNFLHLLSQLEDFDFYSLLAYLDLSQNSPKEGLIEKLRQYFASSQLLISQDSFLNLYQVYLSLGKKSVEHYSTLKASRGALVIFCAQTGHLDILEMTLALGPISAKDRGQALLCALETMHLDSALKLASSGKLLPEDIKTALIKSASWGLETLFNVLWSHQHLPFEVLQEAFIAASRCGQTILVTKLMVSIRFGHNELLLAAQEAFRFGHKALSHKIVITHNHELFFRTHFLQSALAYGCNDLIAYLQEKGSL